VVFHGLHGLRGLRDQGADEEVVGEEGVVAARHQPEQPHQSRWLIHEVAVELEKKPITYKCSV
jgi:hypothetical protein